MTEVEFRVKHSELIEYYQLMEMRLKTACAGLLADKEKDWFARLSDYESDPFGVLIKKIKEIQQLKNLSLLSEDDFVKLDELREKRNYWAHQCFGGQNPIVFNHGELRNPEYAKTIIADLDNAIKWDERLTEVVRSVLR